MRKDPAMRSLLTHSAARSDREGIMQIAWALTSSNQEHHSHSMGCCDVAISSKEARFGGLFVFMHAVFTKSSIALCNSSMTKSH